jgi:hypothetical protein
MRLEHHLEHLAKALFTLSPTPPITISLTLPNALHGGSPSHPWANCTRYKALIFNGRSGEERAQALEKGMGCALDGRDSGKGVLRFTSKGGCGESAVVTLVTRAGPGQASLG